MYSHTRHVPEDQHPSKFLMEHVPGLRNHLLCLGTSIDVQPGGKQKVNHVVSDPASLLVLLNGRRQGEQEEQHPRNSNLGKHLEVNYTKSRVKGDTHKVVIKYVAAHSKGATAVFEDPGKHVDDDGHAVGCDDRNSHDMTKVFNNPRQAVDAGLVEHTSENKGSIPRVKGITLVGKSLVVEGGDRETILIYTRHDSRENELDGSETPVRGKSEFGGVSALSNCQREANESD